MFQNFCFHLEHLEGLEGLECGFPDLSHVKLSLCLFVFVVFEHIELICDYLFHFKLLNLLGSLLVGAYFSCLQLFD